MPSSNKKCQTQTKKDFFSILNKHFSCKNQLSTISVLKVLIIGDQGLRSTSSTAHGLYFSRISSTQKKRFWQVSWNVVIRDEWWEHFKATSNSPLNPGQLWCSFFFEQQLWFSIVKSAWNKVKNDVFIKQSKNCHVSWECLLVLLTLSWKTRICWDTSLER